MTTTDAPDLIGDIVEAREHMVALRERHEREMRAAKRRFAVLLSATRDHPDPAVNPSAAAKACGFRKNYAHQLIRELEAGDLNEGGTTT